MRTQEFLALAGLLLLAACGDRGTQESAAPKATAKPAADGPVRVALIMKAQGNPFFASMEKGARQAQKETGADLTVRSTSEETAIEEQINVVEGVVHDGTQAIVIAPVDSHRLVPALKKAQDAGIKIINIDNRLDAAAMKERGLTPPPFISIDNERAAYRSAKYIADRVTKPSEAAIFEGIRHAANANDRLRGAQRAFAENAQVKLVATETANWNVDEAYAVAKPMFAAHPNIDLVFCANDMMALGLIRYLKEAKRHDVRIASFDDLEDARRAIKAGDIAVTVDQQADKQGYEGVMAAVKAVHGEALPKEIQLDAALVTVDSLKSK
ncbi:MAG: substrate-binding domain-containing protein [Burkholderiales bacterium]|nr:substrate-binding domain-containing protein [Burkholderiales bacterium]